MFHITELSGAVSDRVRPEQTASSKSVSKLYSVNCESAEPARAIIRRRFRVLRGDSLHASATLQCQKRVVSRNPLAKAERSRSDAFPRHVRGRVQPPLLRLGRRRFGGHFHNAAKCPRVGLRGVRGS